MDHPTVSVIIPAKNEEQNIALCLNALKELNYPNDKIEIIIVDNGSTDTTINIAKKYNTKIIEMPHLNISGLRNYGVKNSNGEIIVFIDADILVTKNWLSAGIKIMKSNPEICCLGGYIDIPSKSTWIEKIWHLKLENLSDEFEANWISSMNMFVKKDTFLKVGGFNENLITCEDVDVCFRMKKLGKILFTKKARVIHLGEAKNLKHFFLKERWRGQSNLSGILSHGIHLSELPSIIIPLYYIFFYLSFIPSIIFINNIYVTLIYIGLFVTIPSIRSFLICLRLNRFLYFFPLIFLWWLYYTARSFALFTVIKKRK